MLVTQPQNRFCDLAALGALVLALLVPCLGVFGSDVDLAYRYLASWLLRLFSTSRMPFQADWQSISP